MTDKELKEYDRLINKGLNRSLNDMEKRALNDLSRIKLNAIKTGQFDRAPKPGHAPKLKKKHKPTKAWLKRKAKEEEYQKKIKRERRDAFLTKLGLQP